MAATLQPHIDFATRSIAGRIDDSNLDGSNLTIVWMTQLMDIDAPALIDHMFTIFFCIDFYSFSLPYGASISHEATTKKFWISHSNHQSQNTHTQKN